MTTKRLFWQGRKRCTYKTTEKISAITTINGRLCIFEEGKSKPWEFTLQGTFLNNARFSNDESDKRFLEEKYGLKVFDKESLNKINDGLRESQEIELKK